MKKVFPAQVGAKINEAKKGVDILKGVLNGDAPKTDTVLETVVEPVVNTIVEPVTETTTEPVTEPLTTEPIQEPAVNPVTTSTEEPALSIFDDVKQQTQEDKSIKPKVPGTGNAITDLAEQVSDGEGDDNPIAAKKSADKVHANTVVGLIDVGFMFACILMTWDFSHDNQKRFTLNPERKKEIANNLFQIYQLDNKKRDPKKEIRFLILGSYAPMLFIAMLTMISNIRKWIAERKRKQEEAAQQFTNQYQQPLQQVTVVEESAEMKALRLENERLRKIGNADLTAFDKTKKPRVVKTVVPGEKKTRGVKPGTKRGSYKK